MDIADGNTPGSSWLGRQPAVVQPDPGSGGGAGAGLSTDADAPHGDPIHPRILAMMAASRYHGIELDPHEFRAGQGETEPSAASLSAWAQGSGMWARALRMRWRNLVRMGTGSPVVLLLSDGSAALLVGANTEHKVVMLRDPRAPESDPPIPVDEMRLSEVWDGEVVLLRALRQQAEADPPFTMGWLMSVVLMERKSLKDMIYASIALSFLTILPPLMVMRVMDKVLEHHSYSTLLLIAIILGIMAFYDTMLSFARRLIIVVIGARIDAKLNLHIFSRLLRLPLDYFEVTPAGETMYHVSQVHKVREFFTGKLMTTLLDLITVAVLLPLLFYINATMSWLVLISSILICMIVVAFLKPMRRAYSRVIKAETMKQSALAETVFGMKTVKSLALEPQRKSLWDERVAEAGKWRIEMGKLSNWPQTLVHPIEIFMRLGVILIGAYMLLGGDVTMGFGGLIAFMMLSGRVSAPLVGMAKLME